LSKLFNPAPYNAAANAPDAAGAFPDGSGDPFGSAEMFPLIKNADGSDHVVNAFSYQFVGGADLTGSAAGTIDGYRYGGGDPSVKGAGLSDLLLADPIMAEGGGSVTLTAGRDVLSHRDIWGQARLASYYNGLKSFGYDWFGSPDQQWRLGTIGNASAVWIDPQLFSEGVGALGGGDVTVRAGRDVSDLTVVSDTSVATANVSPGGDAEASLALWTFGSGNVTVDAGRDILGGRFDIASGLGDIEAGRDIASEGSRRLTDSGSNEARSVFLMPSPNGELQLVSGGNIAPTIIDQDDGDPGLLPGIFTIFDANSVGVQTGRTFGFPGVLPNMSDIAREALHNSDPTHLNDPIPNRIYSGGDIIGMILNVAKQTRIGAARDLVNMMFFGQNLNPSDITRIVAGRDITATSPRQRPCSSRSSTRTAIPALRKRRCRATPFIGGPGAFFLEAGRDAGPFLNSAVTDGFASSVGNGDQPTGPLTFSGGIQSVGNDWNPWLAAKGADLYVEFGVAPGQNFDGLRDYYLDPANLGNLDGDLFAQVKDANGNLVPDRGKPIYAPILIKYLQDEQASLLQTLYGTADIDFQQAYDAFKTLPELTQRVFLLGSVYFNELIATSLPDGPSFKQYSRGYQAVNLLFPADLGYTANDLGGGSNGANETVETGNLDLRLAAIETSRGGNIYLLGPGGRVLAGSTVRTSEQAARRTYDGARLFTGDAVFGRCRPRSPRSRRASAARTTRTAATTRRKRRRKKPKAEPDAELIVSAYGRRLHPRVDDAGARSVRSGRHRPRRAGGGGRGCPSRARQ
jgi:hypothetical protein